MVEAGERYRHFKGGEYEVVALVKDCETLKDIVVYRALCDDGRKVKRFELIENRKS